ncbi:Gfo/Idh/MocA family protein [Pigmentiphaga sp. NML080357]|uniref:Gfo/Idh/MocA family oxidoreductase n=1 Tax=Pigmentiphaga sp. NML080357 TaxID=2008675 RepID=UPI001E3AEF4B|nr:Gfo/Idh/MocA family oxidoreductase [Pigmentiphaga sp. NML080357]
MSAREPVRIGIAGMGAAGRAFIAALQSHPGMHWVAVADPSTEVLAEMAAEHGVAGYASLEELLRHPGLDALYIATPTDLHPAHVALAAEAGKHVLVEKPMSVRIDQARAMIAAADAARVVLMVGHSHSYDLPIREMRKLIAGGEMGNVLMANTWCFTDWVYRPRRPEELDDAQGGGVTYRQGAHQVDVLRLLCGGRVRSVRARAFDADPARPVTGAHAIYLDFEDGPVATAIYNGYAGMPSAELCFGIGEWGHPAGMPARRNAPQVSPEGVLRAKRERARGAIPAAAPNQPFFGLTVVHCERGDIRQSPQGLYIYAEGQRREIVLRNDLSPRDLAVAEFHDAIRGIAPPLHDGRWGLANLETCAAALESSATRREIFLKHQIAAPAGIAR